MAKKQARGRGSSKRELINTGRDKRYVKRTTSGRFKESDDVGKSLRQDRQRKATRTVRAGQGDQGVRRRSGGKEK